MSAMKTLQLQFTDSEARRLERVAEGKSDRRLVFVCRKAVLEYLELVEGMRSGHFSQRPHPSAFRRSERR